MIIICNAPKLATAKHVAMDFKACYCSFNEANSCTQIATVPYNLNFTYARAQKATTHNIHDNASE